jgi:hypothetical protein
VPCASLLLPLLLLLRATAADAVRLVYWMGCSWWKALLLLLLSVDWKAHARRKQAWQGSVVEIWFASPRCHCLLWRRRMDTEQGS